MTSSPTPPDPRPALAAAQEWVATLLTAATPDRWTDPTPCAGWDVADLLRHVLALAGRLRVMGEGGAADDAASMVDELPADLAVAFEAGVADAASRWTDPAALARPTSAPFGTVPGAAVLSVYTSEYLTHGWDLAVATGQPSEADAELVRPVLEVMRRMLPGERDETFPFGPPAPVADEAGATEQLARWLGRTG